MDHKLIDEIEFRLLADGTVIIDSKGNIVKPQECDIIPRDESWEEHVDMVKRYLGLSNDQPRDN